MTMRKTPKARAQAQGPDLPWFQCIQLAAEAGVSPESIRKRHRGDPVRGQAGARADDVLRKRGLLREAAE